MSELIVNTNEHYLNLQAYCCGMVEGKNGKALYEEYRNETETVTSSETMQLLDYLLLNYSFDAVKNTVGKLINIFYKSLKEQIWEKPAEEHFLSYLMLENRGVEKIIDEMHIVVKAIFSHSEKDEKELVLQLLRLVNDLKSYELHYIKKENILFPFIESTFPEYRCLQLMWSFHDDFRKTLKSLEELLSHEPLKKDLLNKELGRLFFVVLPIIFREEQIVFPVAMQVVPEKEWDKMLHQSSSIGWCYIEQPQLIKIESVNEPIMDSKIDLGTGFLLPEQIKLMLNMLPLDITFIDENDEVRYFSEGNERIFPRVNAIIGRKVQNCHPADSVHVVNQIIDAFRKGEKDHADFWIQMKARFLHIRYFAVRTDRGEYKGTIEVSQDATEIRLLEGEQRLLDWNNSGKPK